MNWVPGCGAWGSWTGSDDKRIIEFAPSIGRTGSKFFDTAWVYGNGRSESLLGKLLKAYPNKRLYTATKFLEKFSLSHETGI